MKRILGLVLAGGESRRFGTDKALAEIDGRPLIAHAVDSLAPHVEAIVLGGRAYLGLPHVGDRPHPGLGPLGGLNAGLHHALRLGCTHLLTIACDTPFVPAAAFAALAARETAVVIAEHPVIGFWPAALAADLDDFLADDGRRSMRGWMRACGAETLVAGGIVNINHAEDLRACLKAGIATGIARSRA